MPDDVIRIANASGFYGDRFDAPREILEGGPIDVLTGDYLAELTMLILWRGQQKRPDTGYARTFLAQMREVLALAMSRGTRIVANAGGLNPAGLADALRELAIELGVDVRVATVAGDDLTPRLEDLRAAGESLAHLATGAPLEPASTPPLTANAYLGGWGIARALQAGADIVVTGRVTDASLVVGPAAWRFGWARDDWDRLAGAVVAGHVIECGAHATGGNYSFFEDIPGLEHVGFPIAEMAADGSSVITKHPDSGGQVSRGTVTAQLLYEIGGARYLNPDVTTRFDTIRLEDLGGDRVRIHDVRGEPPTDRTKVAVTTFGGFRNRATFVLTGLQVEEKAELVRRQLTARLDLDALDDVEWRLVRSDHPDATDNAAAMAHLTLTVTHRDADSIGRRGFADACVEIGLASYPGFTLTAPPADAEPFSRYWPALVAKEHVPESVTLPDGTTQTIELTAGAPPRDGEFVAHPVPDDGSARQPTRRVPLGQLVGARSGDKGGDANVGFWVRDPRHYPWLARTITPAGIRHLLPEAAALAVEVQPLPNLAAVNVVIRRLLGDGVSSATRPDPQAKGLGEFFRARMVAVPEDLLAE